MTALVCGNGHQIPEADGTWCYQCEPRRCIYGCTCEDPTCEERENEHPPTVNVPGVRSTGWLGAPGVPLVYELPPRVPSLLRAGREAKVTIAIPDMSPPFDVVRVLPVARVDRCGRVAHALVRALAYAGPRSDRSLAFAILVGIPLLAVAYAWLGLAIAWGSYPRRVS